MTGTQLRDLGLARIEQAHPDFLTAQEWKGSVLLPARCSR